MSASTGSDCAHVVKHRQVRPFMLSTSSSSVSLVAMQRLLLLTAIISSSHAAQASVSGEVTSQSEPKHPALLVDTKYWIRNTEFGERANWLHGLKPCTLVERVAFDESLAVSLDDPMDSASIRQLVLSTNGLLLLKAERYYIKYLNESSDCFDSSSLSDNLQETHWFRFAPYADELSWFNAANWESALNGPADDNRQMAALVPESHQIPCGEDVVVFGDRRAALRPVPDPSERSRLIPFKVNFRPSELMLERLLASGDGGAIQGANEASHLLPAPDSLRVSKLKIGDKSYTQKEFDQLTRFYGDILFSFDDPKSVYNLHQLQRRINNNSAGELNTGNNHDDWTQNVLTIDETSVQSGGGDVSDLDELCLDEAGCQCGNERPSLMEIICSFNQPLEPADLPCLDPVRSAGYCNPICAASLNINMDPTQFSERFLASLLDRLMTGESEGDSNGSQQVREVMGSNGDRKPINYYADHLFVGHRRTDYNKYEITVRLLATITTIDYQEIIGRDLEFARLVKSHLEKAATKSFYGIKTISIKSSVSWRSNNRNTIWWLVFIVLLPIVVLATSAQTTLGNVPAVVLGDTRQLGGTTASSTFQSNESTDDTNQEGDQATVQNELAMVELDTHSVAESALGLLIEP